MTFELAKNASNIPFYPVAGGYSLPDGVALLASNECSDAPSEQVVAAAARALSSTNRYPDPSYAALKAAVSQNTTVDPARIAVGNGSCDILLALGEAILNPGDELIFAWPSFSVYPHLAAAAGATEKRIPLDDSQTHDLPAMLAAITEQTKLVIVCNPNNPTSTALPLQQVTDFVESVPEHVVILLDEAYIEFSDLYKPSESIELLKKHPNVMILRTFSKLFGLAGMRVGYGLCSSEELANAVARVRQPFSVSTAAQAAAVAALENYEQVAEKVSKNLASREYLAAELKNLGAVVAESQANFCWLDLPRPQTGFSDQDLADFEFSVVESLRNQNVLVRAGTALGRPGALRVTYGTADENSRFIAALTLALGADR